MKKEELKEILKQHKLWLNSKDNKSKKADLQAAFLQDADLRHADLRGADLRRANLRDVNLQGANLRGADLQGANLRGADLQGANLKDAWISDEEKPNVPLLLGNALVTEVYKPAYWWRIKTWTELKPNEMEMAELLYG